MGEVDWSSKRVRWLLCLFHSEDVNGLDVAMIGVGCLVEDDCTRTYEMTNDERYYSIHMELVEDLESF